MLYFTSYMWSFQYYRSLDQEQAQIIMYFQLRGRNTRAERRVRTAHQYNPLPNWLVLTYSIEILEHFADSDQLIVELIIRGWTGQEVVSIRDE